MHISFLALFLSDVPGSGKWDYDLLYAYKDEQ